jgi:hypothetical protein
MGFEYYSYVKNELLLNRTLRYFEHYSYSYDFNFDFDWGISICMLI